MIKLLFSPDDGRIFGAQAVGTQGVEKRIDVIAMAIQKQGTVFDLEEAELCYAPQYGAAKDPVNIVGMIASNVVRNECAISHWTELDQSDVYLLDTRYRGVSIRHSSSSTFTFFRRLIRGDTKEPTAIMINTRLMGCVTNIMGFPWAMISDILRCSSS